MSLIEWTDDLSVGVPLVDEHHKQLIALLRALYEAIHGGDTQEAVGKVLTELVDYTHYHFTTEERLLEEAGYPSLENHRMIHRILTDQVNRMQREYMDDPRNVFAAELFQFLSAWLIGHIKSEDFAYRSCLLSA